MMHGVVVGIDVVTGIHGCGVVVVGGGGGYVGCLCFL
jgi:hypothetical protein